MKNRLLKVVFLTILAVSLTDCSKTKLVQDSLSDSYPDELVFLPTGSGTSLVMTFNDKWHMTAPSWIQCSRTSGLEGTVMLQINTSVNRTGQDLSGIISFECDDGSTVSLPAFQPRPYLKVTFSGADNVVSSDGYSNDAAISFNWDDSREHGGRYLSVNVESNVDWRFDYKDLSTPENEFVLSQDHGFGSAKLTLTPRRNNVDREAYDCLLTADAYMPGDGGERIGQGVESYSFPLHQNNLRFLINDDPNDIECFVDELGEQSISIEIDSELPWSVFGLPDWVKMTSVSGEAGISQVAIQANGINPSREERGFDIVLHSTGGAERVVHFKQNPFVFSVDKPEVTMDNEGLTTVELNFSSSGPWTVTGPEWLNMSASGQEGNGTVTISCIKQNLDLKDLEGIICFTSQLNGLTEEAKITQEAFLFDITADEIIKKIPAMSTESYPIDIKSSGDWSVSTEQSWVSLSSEAGSKVGTIRVGANSNNPDLSNDRNAVITFVSETHKEKGITLKKEIALTQTKFLFDCNLLTSSVPAYSASSSVLLLDIVCSYQWEIVECPSWLVPEATSGVFDKKLAFSISPNTNKSQTRSGSIKIRSKYNNKYLTTGTITQDKFVFNVSKTTFSNLPPIGAGQFDFTINSTNEVPWEIIPNGNWLSSSTSSGKGNSTIVITPEDNLKTSNRSSTVTVHNTVSNENITVNVSQTAFVFSVPASSFSFGELDDSRKSFTIDCSSDWTIEYDNANWISLSDKSGSGRKDVFLSANKNVATSSRSATITVYSNRQRGTADELKKSITITQDAYKFDSKSESFTGLEPLNEKGTSKTVKITCSGEWVVESVPDWISVKPSSGSGEGTLTITPSSNTGLTDRSASFAVVSRDNSNLRKNITVGQKAYVFSVDTQTMEFTSSASSKGINIKSTAKWTIQTNQTWISVSKKEGDGNQAVVVSVDANTGKTDRTGKVTITSQYGNHVLTIDVTQKKP